MPDRPEPLPILLRTPAGRSASWHLQATGVALALTALSAVERTQVSPTVTVAAAGTTALSLSTRSTALALQVAAGRLTLSAAAIRLTVDVDELL